MQSLKVFWPEANIKKVKWLEQDIFLKLYADYCGNEKWNITTSNLLNETLPILSFVDTLPNIMYRETFGLFYCKEFTNISDSNFPAWAIPSLREATFVPRILDCNENPLVSVIIITLNREDGCVKAINSVLNQTYKNFKCIVVKDGPGIYESLPKDPRITFLNAPKQGVYPETPTEKWHVAGRDPLNIGFSLAQGPIVCRLDDDDLFMPHHLETIVDAWLKTKANLIYTEPNRENGNKQFMFPFDRNLIKHRNFMFTCNTAFCGAALGLMNIPPVANIPGDWASLQRIAESNLPVHKVPIVTSIHTDETFERKK